MHHRSGTYFHDSKQENTVLQKAYSVPNIFFLLVHLLIDWHTNKERDIRRPTRELWQYIFPRATIYTINYEHIIMLTLWFLKCLC